MVLSTCIECSFKTHSSELRGQEETGLCDEPVRRTSELFTRSTAVKLAKALNKPP